MLQKLNLLALFLISNIITAQNLITDPSFEDYYGCPNQIGQFDSLKHWFTVSETPDCYNSCANGNNAGVPQNWAGTQAPQNGSGYIGLFLNGQPNINYREIVAQQLNSSLQIGIKYYCSFYLNFAGQQVSFCIAKNMGVKFFTINPLNSPFGNIVNNISNYKVDTFLIDSTNWVQFTFSFIADSAYNYISLGNFYDDLNTPYILLDTNITTKCASYYYIDEICLSTDSLQCLNTSISEAVNIYLFVFPNPTTDGFKIQSRKKIVSIDMINNLGISVISNFVIENINANEFVIQRKNLVPFGIYTLLVNTDNSIVTHKISLTN